MRSAGSEWPLVFFTLMMQMSVGFFVALSFFYDKLFVKNSALLSRESSGKMFLIICPVIFLALIISFFHLGSPRNAIYVLGNISHSWLSREILFSIIFSGLAFASAFLFYNESFLPHLRQMILISCAIIGIILVFVMSRLYMLETVPAWNTYHTPFSFFTAAMILGSSTLLTLLTFSAQQSKNNFSFSSETAAAAKFLLGLCILLVAIEIIMWLLHLKLLSGASGASRESFNLIINNHSVLFFIKITLSALILIFLSYALYSFGKNDTGNTLIYLSYFLLILFEFIGRFLFYSMYVRNGI